MSNPVYDNIGFWVPGVNYGSGSGPTLTADEIRAAMGKNFVIGKSSIDGRSLIARQVDAAGTTALYEMDGVTPVADGSAFEPAGSDKVTVIMGEAGDMTEGFQYRGTLAPGSYDRAALLALSGGTAIVELGATVAVGTADFTQGGSIMNLPASSIILHEYKPGLSMADFTLNVDTASEVFIEITAV